jgi:hypothetical protein
MRRDRRGGAIGDDAVDSAHLASETHMPGVRAAERAGLCLLPAACPNCRAVVVRDFAHATDTQLKNLGLETGD